MYDAAYLSVYPFFEKAFRDRPLSAVLDSLTGVVSRACMIEFLHDLVDRKQVFTVGMIDVDNFKSYNDNYGHRIGDLVLQHVGRSLIEYVGTRGVVGRFGGDEFLVVAFIGNDYKTVHSFYEHLFFQGSLGNQDAVFRRDIHIDSLQLFLSATVGSASFPKDAQDYDTLFSLVDRTLYRGKSKGRNCYIIYVPEKHAHLEIPSLARRSLYNTLTDLAAAFDAGGDSDARLSRACQVLRRDMRFHFFFRIGPDGRILDVDQQRVIGTCEDLSPLITSGCFTCSSLGELQGGFPALTALMAPYVIQSLMILPVGPLERKQGFLLLSPEPKTLHIWQDEELAAGFFLSRLLQEIL